MSHIFRFFKGVMAFRAPQLSHIGLKSFLKNGELLCSIRAFLNFRDFDFCSFRFNAVYNSILFSSSSVLLSNLDFHGFLFPRFFLCVPTLTAEIEECLQVSFIQTSSIGVVNIKNNVPNPLLPHIPFFGCQLYFFFAPYPPSLYLNL